MLTPRSIQCPYCGERIEILVDATAGDQQYIEDCQVCCQPISVSVWIGADQGVHVSVAGENEV